MTKYVYQIQGALENADGKFSGFQVFVGVENIVQILTVPPEEFERETKSYIEYRLQLTEGFDIRKLPPTVEMDIRMPIEHWLDDWINYNFYGDISE
jgi:hypothetical protein